MASKATEYSKAYQVRHLAAGLCRSCDSPALPERTLCAKHKALQGVASAAWRAKNPGAAAKLSKATREAYRAAGGCVECGAAPVEGAVRCARHLLRARKNWSLYIKRHPRPKKRAFIQAAREARNAEYLVSAVPVLRNADPNVKQWIREHKELFYDKGDRFLWNAAALDEAHYEVGDLSAALDTDSGSDAEV